MNHRDFLRSLSKDEKRSLTEKNDTSGILRLAVLTFLLLIFSSAILNRVPYWIFLLVPQGLLVISLFHLLHECIHDTPFRTQKLNSTVAAICGFILLLPSEWFRYFHRDHHRYTQIEGKDPELHFAKPATKSQWLLHISGLPVFKSLLIVIAKYTLGKAQDSYIPGGARPGVIRQVRIMAAGYLVLFIICATLQTYALFWIWTVPLIIGQPFLRLYLLAEHTFCDNTDNMFLNTRTVLSNSVIRWFTWNMPYHTEHHVYPAVPFHQLPELHAKMSEYLAHKDKTYHEFNRRLYTTLD